MSDEGVLRIEPRWARWRYLFHDGRIMDVESPYRSDSTDREAVLDEALRRWGPDEKRRIEGVARVDWDGSPLKRVPVMKKAAKKVAK